MICDDTRWLLSFSVRDRQPRLTVWVLLPQLTQQSQVQFLMRAYILLDSSDVRNCSVIEVSLSIIGFTDLNFSTLCFLQAEHSRQFNSKLAQPNNRRTWLWDAFLINIIILFFPTGQKWLNEEKVSPKLHLFTPPDRCFFWSSDSQILVGIRITWRVCKSECGASPLQILIQWVWGVPREGSFLVIP